MTYVVGFKTKKSVFIAGDSAITYNRSRAIRDKVTSFGEKQVARKDLTIHEECLKIYNFDNKLIVGIAGNVGIALKVIDSLRDELKKGSIKEAVTYSLFENRWPIEIAIIAGFMEKDEAILMTYNANDHKIDFHDTSAQIGGLNEVYREVSSDISTQLIENETSFSDDEALLMICAAHQQFVISDELIKYGVGGFFIGAYVNSSGVNWLKDTTYILFSINQERIDEGIRDPNIIFPGGGVINICVRDNVVSVSSPFPSIGDQRRIYRNCRNRSNSKEEYNKRINQDIDWQKKMVFKAQQFNGEFNLRFLLLHGEKE
jgi:ATP-dependent protease HslVU (ClpYQ) peptidase subunit